MLTILGSVAKVMGDPWLPRAASPVAKVTGLSSFCYIYLLAFVRVETSAVAIVYIYDFNQVG